MMTGQDLFYFICSHPFYRLIEKLRIRGWIKGIKTALVNQITRIKVSSFRFIKTTVPRRMSWRVDHLNFPSTQVQPIAVSQNPLRITMIDLIRIHIKSCWKIAWHFRQILLCNLQRYGKLNRKPILFRLMYSDIIKIFVPTDMIPVNMSCNHHNRQSC